MEGIKETILKFLRIDSLVDHLSGYVDVRVKLLKIEIREEVAKVLSHGLVHITLAFFAFLFLIFVSIGIANYLNSVLGDSFSGYWIVAGVYLVLFGIMILFRKKIDRSFEKYFSGLIKQKEEE